MDEFYECYFLQKSIIRYGLWQKRWAHRNIRSEQMTAANLYMLQQVRQMEKCSFHVSPEFVQHNLAKRERWKHYRRARTYARTRKSLQFSLQVSFSIECWIRDKADRSYLSPTLAWPHVHHVIKITRTAFYFLPPAFTCAVENLNDQSAYTIYMK